MTLVIQIRMTIDTVPVDVKKKSEGAEILRGDASRSAFPSRDAFKRIRL